MGWGNPDRRDRDDWIWCYHGVVAAFWVRRGWNRLAAFALLRVSGTWCHPRGGEAASQMCMWEGGTGKPAWLCPLSGHCPVVRLLRGKGVGPPEC